MAAYALPAGYALFLWWFSTGAVLYLDGLSRRSFPWSMAAGTLVLGAAIYGLATSRDDVSATGAYCGFTCGLLAWAWQELGFYLGYVTGPRKILCQRGCSGWRHFGHAIQASLYHEIAILTVGAIVVAVAWPGRNHVGIWTYALLLVMHESARLNVFLGVRNVNEEFLPPHLEFLKSFLTRKPMNLLFPISITASTVVALILIQCAAASGASAFERASFTYLATLLSLAIVEHWFLMLPLPFARLWQWGLASRRRLLRTDGGHARPPERPLPERPLNVYQAPARV